MTYMGLKMIIFGLFSRFLASFKISFSSLQHPKHNEEQNHLLFKKRYSRKECFVVSHPVYHPDLQ